MWSARAEAVHLPVDVGMPGLDETAKPTIYRYGTPAWSSGGSAAGLPQRPSAGGLQLAQVCVAALRGPQQCFGHSFARLMIATVGHFLADGLQRHFQIGGSP